MQQTKEQFQVKLTKEEQRRFEILDGHWDVPIKDVDLEAR